MLGVDFAWVDAFSSGFDDHLAEGLPMRPRPDDVDLWGAFELGVELAEIAGVRAPGIVST